MQYNDIKDFASNFNTKNPSTEEQAKLKAICDYLHFAYNDCRCRSLWRTLFEKLVNWLKYHKEICKYTMPNGVFLYTADGRRVYKFRLTNADAEELLQTEEGQKYITIIPEFAELDNEGEESIETEDVDNTEVESMDDIQAKLDDVQQRKNGKRKITGKHK